MRAERGWPGEQCNVAADCGGVQQREAPQVRGVTNEAAAGYWERLDEQKSIMRYLRKTACVKPIAGSAGLALARQAEMDAHRVNHTSAAREQVPGARTCARAGGPFRVGTRTRCSDQPVARDTERRLGSGGDGRGRRGRYSCIRLFSPSSHVSFFDLI